MKKIQEPNKNEEWKIRNKNKLNKLQQEKAEALIPIDTILVGREPVLSIVSLSDCTGRIETPSETRLGCLKGRHNGCEIAVDKSGIVERHKRLREVAVW